MDRPEPPKCQDCVYAEDTEDAMRCHRYPPQVVTAENDDCGRWYQVEAWPEVAASEWCGEFRARGLWTT